MKDIVVVFVEKILLKDGFIKKGNHFFKKMDESEVDIKIQNNSFGKHQHYINVTINFDQKIAEEKNMQDCFGVWFRAESLNFKKKQEQLEILNSKAPIEDEFRFFCIEKILNEDMRKIINSWGTYDGAKSFFLSDDTEAVVVSHELKLKWQKIF